MIGLWLPVAAWMAAIYYGAGMPEVPSAIGERFTDTVLHGAGYAGLALLTLRATAGGRWAGVTTAAIVAAFAIAVAHGITVELEQMLVPTRSAEWRDVGNDAAGAAAGLGAAWAWSIMRRKFS